MHDYLAARTSFFDRTVVGAMDRGVRQVVVGAAGYDGRAFRYAKPGVRWFEVDHPATQRDKLERLARLGIAGSQVRFVEADFTRDQAADRLLAAGFEATVPSLFLLEGVAVYLEPAVLETVLEQFRQVAAPGSRLAISVSLSREHDEGARARFQAAVAALGKPARSTFDASQAKDLLARTGWQAIPGRAETAGKRERLRSAGLLRPSPGLAPARHPRRPSQPSRPRRPRLSDRPRRPRHPRPRQVLSPWRPCCPKRWSPSRSSLTTKPNTASRTAPPIREPLGTATAPGWCPWSCRRTACGMSPTSRSRSASSRPARGPERTWMACGAGATSPSTALPGRSQESAGPGCRLARHRKGAAGASGVAAAARPHRAALAERFGAGQVGRLRESLITAVSQLDPGLPDCLPILGAALLSRGPDPALPPPGDVDLPGYHCRRCYPGCCFRSPWSTSVKRGCPSRSARTRCVSWARKGSGGATSRR